MQAEKILQRMTLDEKLNLCCGGDFWKTIPLSLYGLEPLTMADGPHGLRYQAGNGDMLGVNDSEPATCFPTASLTACSWDEKLVGEIASAITAEAAIYGVDVVLGPGVNMKRNPLCGRNFEYFSEDPYLSGKLGAVFVREGQKNGVGACLKHFAGNSQEYKRFSSNDYMDERTLREIYLPAFERAVKEGNPAFVMCAYNKINGVYCSDNRTLLTDILRKEWGFSGTVVTDWGAMHDRAAGFAAGCDLSMPGGSKHHQRHAKKAIAEGRLNEDDVDASALRILERLVLAQKRKDHVSDRSGEAQREIWDMHHALAKKAALESAVLLKNDGILPLQTEHVCLIGDMAEHPRYQGSGSSHINPTKLVSLREKAPHWAYAHGYDQKGATNETLLREAKRAAKKAEVAIVLAGLTDSYESEGFDRKDMKMPRGHLELIEAVAESNKNTVVLLAGGSPMEIPWFDKVRAVLYMGLCGQAGYEAAFDLLTGEANPSGKIAETWFHKYEDVPCSSYYGEKYKNPQYREGIYIGYRYSETAKIPVRFPFGFGLSYTVFEYKELSVEDDRVSVTIKNTGQREGAEIVQLYISPFKRCVSLREFTAGKENAEKRYTVFRPERELKGFERVFLQPGEEKTVEFYLDERSFAVWQDGWKIPEGSYEIQIGASAQDIRLRREIQIKEGKNGSFLKKQPGFENDISYLKEESPGTASWRRIDGSASPGWYEHLSGIPTQQDLEKNLGYRIPAEKPLKRGEFTMENTIVEMAEYSLFLKAVKWAMEKVIGKMYGVKPDDNNPEFRMSMASSADSALFSAVNNGGKILPEHLAYALLDVANGKFLRAVRRVFLRK